MHEATITPTDNGPYLIQGNITLIDAEGNTYEASDTIALCRFGHSNTNPSAVGTRSRTSPP
jgi:CDGSH-type Zn-finger protein